jgi:hypothetical protein
MMTVCDTVIPHVFESACGHFYKIEGYTGLSNVENFSAQVYTNVRLGAGPVEHNYTGAGGLL